jgi:hypothetical protein
MAANGGANVIIFLLSAILALLIVIASTLEKILKDLRGQGKRIPSGTEHFEQFDPKKESREHFMGRTANSILEEKQRQEIWNPEKESREEFMRRGQQPR